MFATTATEPQPRLGIVVAKRNVKLAVKRNKLKRMIRESFRLQQQLLMGLDVVVVVKQEFMLWNEEAKQAGVFVGVGDKRSRCYQG